MSATIMPMEIEEETTAPEREPNREEKRPREVEEEQFVPLETSVLLSTETEDVLGVSAMVADGAMFVVTSDRIPLGSEVDIALVLPARERTIRMKGEVAFWHEADEARGFDRDGLGISIDPDSVNV